MHLPDTESVRPIYCNRTATGLAATYPNDWTRSARQRIFPYIKRFPGLLEPVVLEEPDLNDGVRLNIRPFVQAGVLRARLNIKWNKDRGKNPNGSERHNDLHLTRAEVPAIVDAQKALLRGALAEGPFLVKPNLEETAVALDLSLTDDEEDDAEAAVAALIEVGAEWALVTTGATGAMLGDASGGRWKLQPPKVEAVNPIGSGDALAAGLAVALARGETVPEAAAFGTACAAANVLTPTSGVVRPEDVERLRPAVRLTRLA
jgi:uncharacterized glyoxalase superfamily protein PhnB